MWSTVAVTATLGLMVLLTTAGNSLVCLSVWRVKKLRRPSNYLLASLSVSDLGVALFVMPPAIFLRLNGSLGPHLCDVWIALDITFCTASILNLCAICVDRYLTISQPLTYGTAPPKSRPWLCIAATWTLAVLISVPPPILLGNEHGTPTHPACEVSQNPTYQLYATLGSFYIPLILMSTLYLRIYVSAQRLAHGGEPAGGKAGRRSLIRSEWKASVTLGVIMIVFTLCWLPFFMIALLRSLRALEVGETFRELVLWLGYSNSMLNPVIYVAFHQDFRQSFRLIASCRWDLINQTFREQKFKSMYGLS